MPFSSDNKNNNQESIIDFIEDKEVHDFSENIKSKKRIITVSAIAIAFTLFGAVYILPDFLSEAHRKHMKFSADIIRSSHNETINSKNIKSENLQILHGTEN